MPHRAGVLRDSTASPNLGMHTTHGFTGQREDTQAPGSSGLDDFGARYYDPAVGRFTSVDSVLSGLGDPLGLDPLQLRRRARDQRHYRRAIDRGYHQLLRVARRHERQPGSSGVTVRAGGIDNLRREYRQLAMAMAPSLCVLRDFHSATPG
ncbi:MAG TPA: RHS repeat-associated core domain-containing protein [Ktedonobacterales bacterium]